MKHHLIKLTLGCVIVTLLYGSIYMVGQQIMRQNANDPQVQLSEDIGNQIAAGQSPTSVVPTQQVDVAHSLAPFVMVFDDQNQLLASTAQLNNQAVNVPPGVLKFARDNGQDRVTWQPATGVRSAVVATHYSGANPGVVVVGRSLYEVEKRIDNLGILVAMAWMVTIGAVTLLVLTSANERTRNHT